MRSDTLVQLLAALCATRSFMRQHVSNDNAFSVGQFKTLKHQPDYPQRFAGLEHAKGWLRSFFGRQNPSVGNNEIQRTPRRSNHSICAGSRGRALKEGNTIRHIIKLHLDDDVRSITRICR